MHSTSVVERNIAAQYGKHLTALGKNTTANHIRLHRMEEEFHEGIVGHFSWTVHALGDLQLRQALPESIGGIFNATIRVEDESPVADDGCPRLPYRRRRSPADA